MKDQIDDKMELTRKLTFCVSVYLILAVLGSPDAVFANKYPQVFFGNSTMQGYYGYSRVSQSGESWVENVKGHAPLSEQHFFTPRNSISLRYISSSNGLWELEILYPSRELYYLNTVDKILTFRIYAKRYASMESLPHLKIRYGDTCTRAVPIAKYIRELDTAEWIKVSIPLRDFSDLKVGDHIRAITFHQGGPTAREDYNHLFLDQLEFEQSVENKLKLLYPAILSKALPYEKHVELEWQLPLNPGIKYVKIYRSIDEVNFEPVGMVPVFVTSYSDLVPDSHRTYHYKISWVDVDYEESPFSKVLKAQTKPMDEGAWLDLMQKSHIQFFMERTEINSGMHAVSFDKQKVVVSVEETGYAILAKVVGVERGFVNAGGFVNNLRKLTEYLKKATHHRGVFPRYLDGRTGKAVSFRATNERFHLVSTSGLMMGLMAANQYLDRMEDESKAFSDQRKVIQKNIQVLWDRVNWKEFYSAEDRAFWDSWDSRNAFEEARLLGGLSTDFIPYLLAAAHQKHSPGEGIYLEGVRHFRPESVHIEDDSLAQALQFPSEGLPKPLQPGSAEKYPIRKDTVAYGLRFALGNHMERHLLETYQPFMVVNPFTFQDSIMHYGPELTNLTEAFRRRDNEMNAGVYFPEVWGTSQGRSTLDWSAIVPAISVSSYVFQPEYAVMSMKRLYLDYGQDIFTDSGFRTWFNLHENTVSESHRGLNQAMVAVMIENSRTGLIWDLFSEHADIAKFLDKINIYDQ